MTPEPKERFTEPAELLPVLRYSHFVLESHAEFTGEHRIPNNAASCADMVKDAIARIEGAPVSDKPSLPPGLQEVLEELPIAAAIAGKLKHKSSPSHDAA